MLLRQKITPTVHRLQEQLFLRDNTNPFKGVASTHATLRALLSINPHPATAHNLVDGTNFEYTLFNPKNWELWCSCKDQPKISPSLKVPSTTPGEYSPPPSDRNHIHLECRTWFRSEKEYTVSHLNLTTQLRGNLARWKDFVSVGSSNTILMKFHFGNSRSTRSKRALRS